jgi:hypothetical protein
VFFSAKFSAPIVFFAETHLSLRVLFFFRGAFSFFHMLDNRRAARWVLWGITLPNLRESGLSGRKGFQ